MYTYPTQTPKPKQQFRESNLDPKTEALGLILNYGIENFFSSYVAELHPAIAAASSEGNNPSGVPDPVAGGSDGFRFFKDWRETGGSISNTSGAFPCVFSTLMYVKNMTLFKDALMFVFERLADKTVAPMSETEIANLVAKQAEYKNRELTPEEKQERLGKIEKVFKRTSRASQSHQVAEYLAGRGLKGDFSLLPTSLGYVSELWYGDKTGIAQKLSGMVAIMSDVNSKPWTIHRTYLDPISNHKADVLNAKVVMSPPISLNGLSIKLDKPLRIPGANGDPEIVMLGLSEGIENALAIREGTGIPMWACYNNYVMEAVELPPEVTHVVIFEDKDRKGAGQRSASALAKKLKEAGIEASIESPPSPIPAGEKGIDWLDEYNLNGLEAFRYYLDDSVGIVTGVLRSANDEEELLLSA